MFKAFLTLCKTSLRRQWLVYFIVLLVFTLGLTAGFAGVQKLQTDQTDQLQSEVDRFLQQAGMLEIDFSMATRDVIYNGIILVVAIYLLGLTIIGIPFVLAILFVRGFALGFAIEFLTREKSIQGTVLTIVAILPHNILMIPALLFAGAASLSFAWLLAKRFHNSKIQIWPSFIAYSGIMVLVTVCFAGAGLVEVYLTPLLIKIAANYVF
ncbi:MAG: Stage II sporulation protein M [Pelotomaculum sp. PtaB.Bin013]|uniref:Stage II sporulation protein M n=1 Tax=Pelotomaculum isophthalicicum JI TaxID=947010 RepID=A0A9X4H2Q1_9FIRM|nr:stage II sporulation protein M [Pelotomaculum isophthalicicum]MDF9409045.1 stage II sporulation protein M [Pelotomaculum isophthalicicum JI]OPX86390.1 MAG: Stage II sporulation protein M [Pelotomaculum sp. PtaB.Bin013]